MAILSDLTNAARRAPGSPKQREGAATLLTAGGILAGLGVASCCVLPFLLFAAGISGAWIANLTALEPYRLYFAGIAIGCIALGFTASTAGRRLHAPTIRIAPGPRRTASPRSACGAPPRLSRSPSPPPTSSPVGSERRAQTLLEQMMKPVVEHEMKRQNNVDAVVASILGMLPTLDVGDQNLSLELYRLLAQGQPVPREALAERANVSIETVGRFLDRWPGVFSDPEQRVIGYWGLSIPTADFEPASPDNRRQTAQRLVRLGYVVPAPTPQRDRQDRVR